MALPRPAPVLRLAALLPLAVLCGPTLAPAQDAAPCSPARLAAIERQSQPLDRSGHGPDRGSAEWASAVEWRLGLRGRDDLPARGSRAWCERIEAALRQRDEQARLYASRPGPTFSCRGVQPGSIPDLVCADTALGTLDRDLQRVYAQAARTAAHERPPVLKAEQRGWVRGRDDCWKSDDRRACVADAYVTRIAELQARYRLVAHRGPFRFSCNGQPADEVLITHFQTDPPTLIAERGDQTSLMFLQPAASGTRYVGRNESFWEHQGEATVVWGHGAPEMRCILDR